jgi:hypothetical protein
LTSKPVDNDVQKLNNPAQTDLSNISFTPKGNKQPSNFDRKLDRDQRNFALRMYSEGYSPSVIIKEIKDRFDIVVSTTCIVGTCKAKYNQPLVAEFRKKYLSDLRKVPIYHKRIRLEDLEVSRRKLISHIKTNKGIDKKERDELCNLIQRHNEVIKVAREEIENKPQLVSNVIMNTTNIQNDDDLYRRKEELLRKANIFDRRGDSGVVPDSGGVGQQDNEQPPEILLAAPEELRRDELPASDDYV